MAQGGRGGLEGTENFQSLSGEVAELLATQAGMTSRNIYFLLAVKKKRPDLYQKVYEGTYSINKAHTEMKRDEMPPTTAELGNSTKYSEVESSLKSEVSGEVADG